MVLEDAIRTLLRRRPELRLELAVEKYRRGTVSLNRAAERAGVSTEECKSDLAERGIAGEAGFFESIVEKSVSFGTMTWPCYDDIRA